MIADIDAGRVYNDTMERDYEAVRGQMRRRELIVTELNRERGTLRGPGTPGWRGGVEYGGG